MSVNYRDFYRPNEYDLRDHLMTFLAPNTNNIKASMANVE